MANAVALAAGLVVAGLLVTCGVFLIAGAGVSAIVGGLLLAGLTVFFFADIERSESS